MKEYQVKVTFRHNTGIFPDLFGTTETFYQTAESAQVLEERFWGEFKKNFAFELEMGEISCSLDIQEV